MFRKLYHLFLVLTGRNERYARAIGVIIGSDCRILTRFFGSEPFLIEIGDRVTLSRDVIFINHDGSTWLMRDERGRRQYFRRIRIGNDVFVGARAILLPGVSLGNRVVVGAGSVVTRSVPDNSVVAGNPARFICTFDSLRERMLRDLPAQSELPNAANAEAFARAALDVTFKPDLARLSGHG